MNDANEDATGFSKLGWELLENRTFRSDKERHVAVHRVERARVPGGWLVRAYSATSAMAETDSLVFGRGVGVGAGVGVGLTFVPDPQHAWAP